MGSSRVLSACATLRELDPALAQHIRPAGQLAFDYPEPPPKDPKTHDWRFVGLDEQPAGLVSRYQCELCSRGMTRLDKAGETRVAYYDQDGHPLEKRPLCVFLESAE